MCGSFELGSLCGLVLSVFSSLASISRRKRELVDDVLIFYVRAILEQMIHCISYKASVQAIHILCFVVDSFYYYCYSHCLWKFC